MKVEAGKSQRDRDMAEFVPADPGGMDGDAECGKEKRDGECFPMLRGFHEGFGRQHQPCMAVQACSRFPYTAMEFHRYSIPTCIPIETQGAWKTIALSVVRKQSQPAIHIVGDFLNGRTIVGASAFSRMQQIQQSRQTGRPQGDTDCED